MNSLLDIEREATARHNQLASAGRPDQWVTVERATEVPFSEPLPEVDVFLGE